MLSKVVLSNFRMLDFECEFPPGVVLVQAPNGKGKTTLVEGSLFALFGTDALRTRKQDAKGPRDGPTGVSLTGKVHDTFTVERMFGGQCQVTTTSGMDIEGAQKARKYFSDLFTDFKTFCNTFICRQKEVDLFVSMYPSQRLKFLTELLGLTVVQDSLKGLPSSLPSFPEPDYDVDEELGDIAKKISNLTLSTIQEAQALRAQLEHSKIWYDKKSELEKLTSLSQQAQQILGQFAAEKSFLDLATSRSQEGGNCPVCEQSLEGPLSAVLQPRITSLQEKTVQLQNTISEASKKISSLASATSAIDPKLLEERLIGAPTMAPEEFIRLDQRQRDLEASKSHIIGRDEIERLQNEVLTRKFLSEFSKYLVIDIFQDLRARISQFLCETSPFSTFDLLENGNILVDDRPLESYSGGQVDTVCLLFRIAVSSMLAELRFGFIPFIILDSAFDAMDEHYYDVILQFLLNHVEDFNQVIITSHRDIHIPGVEKFYLA